MAIPEQITQIQQSTDAWNAWRKRQKDVSIDLSGADLSGANLRKANLSRADLSGASLSGANLSDANLIKANLIKANLIKANLIGAIISGADLIVANLSDADLSGTDLSDADLRGAILSRTNLNRANLNRAILNRADLRGANLRGANLRGANLSRADLSGAYLNNANLSGTYLSKTNLSGADLSGAYLSNAITQETHFTNIDLRQVKGLESIDHAGPSHISTSTLEKSQGGIPDIFLRKAGLSDTFINAIRALFSQTIEYYTCFISYSSKDQAFAERLYTDLQNNGIRCWLAPEVLKIDEKFRKRINESIRLHDKMLLILSEHSINSPWIETAVEAAVKKEHRTEKVVLFPLILDDALMHTDRSWATDIRYIRHIGSFKEWRDHDAYIKGLDRLLRDLKQSSVNT